MNYELALVMPVYNEEGCILHVVDSWVKQLTALHIHFKFIILNDGSKDQTQSILKKFEGNPSFEIINKPNSGHGATVLMGYRKAVDIADWVFQCDSDDEIKADQFPSIWSARPNFDAVLGIRTNRQQTISRKVLSQCSRVVVGLLYGNTIKDVNVPFRLMKAGILKSIIHNIPDSLFAPNVIISGSLAHGSTKIKQMNVHHENRKSGTVSLKDFKLLKAAAAAFWQTLTVRPLIGKALKA